MKRLDERLDAAERARPVGRTVGGASSDDVWRPRGGGPSARAIASLVPRITQKSFEKHGFAAASLIMDWAQIVGSERARDTRPLKLKWPRPVEKFGETAESCEGRPGATLVLQVDPAVALDIQYQSAQLIERINAYFGYRAVASLRLVQETFTHHASNGPNLAVPVTPGAEGQRSDNVAKGRSGADDDPLSAALARLGATIAAQIRGRNAD